MVMAGKADPVSRSNEPPARIPLGLKDRMVKVQKSLVASPRNQSQTNFLNSIVRP